MNPYSAVLCHHGILGMMWGKRNGPPYPLDEAVSTGHKLKRDIERSKNNIVNEKSNIKKGMKIAGEVLAITGAVAIGIAAEKYIPRYKQWVPKAAKGYYRLMASHMPRGL